MSRVGVATALSIAGVLAAAGAAAAVNTQVLSAASSAGTVTAGKSALTITDPATNAIPNALRDEQAKSRTNPNAANPCRGTLGRATADSMPTGCVQPGVGARTVPAGATNEAEAADTNSDRALRTRDSAPTRDSSSKNRPDRDRPEGKRPADSDRPTRPPRPTAGERPARPGGPAHAPESSRPERPEGLAEQERPDQLDRPEGPNRPPDD